MLPWKTLPLFVTASLADLPDKDVIFLYTTEAIYHIHEPGTNPETYAISVRRFIDALCILRTTPRRDVLALGEYLC